jgi:hypothetical protein
LGGYWRLSVSNFDEAPFALCAADDKMDAIVYVNDSLLRNAPCGDLSLRPNFQTNKPFQLRSSATKPWPQTSPLCPEKMPASHRAEALNAQEMRLKSYQDTTRANGRKASEHARYRKPTLSHRAEE